MYGVGAVRRYGAVVGLLLAARYVASCGLCEPYGPVRTGRVLLMFVRLAVTSEPVGPGRYCGDGR